MRTVRQSLFRTITRWAALPVLFLLQACAAMLPPPTAPGLPVFEVEYLEERALLLLLADRLTYDDLAVDRAREASDEVRRQLALTLARIGDPRGVPVLEQLLGDASLDVRRAAIFALGELGELGYVQGKAALLTAVAADDRHSGRLAVEALAKMGVPLEEVIARLIIAPAAEFLPRLLPGLFLFSSSEEPSGAAVIAWAEQGLELDEPEARAMAAYALARRPRPEGAVLLRSLLKDGDPWIRGWAARGLGQVGDRADFDRLLPLLADAAPGPIIQALRAARRLIDDGKAAPPEAWRQPLLELLGDPRPGVRHTAIEVAAAWLLDEDLGERLAALAGSPQARERQLATLALAEGEDPRALSFVVELAEAPEPALRATAAEAAAFLRAMPLVERLADAADPSVRVAALGALILLAPSNAEERVRRALADRDPAVRANALAWCQEHPVVEMELLLAAISAQWRDGITDARVAGVAALEARALQQPLERGAIVERLEKLATDGEYLVRRRAAEALETLSRPRPQIGAVRTGKIAQVYRDMVRRTLHRRSAEIVTVKGSIEVEIDCPAAPLTCLNFLQLAAQGFYEGIVFHRVVPDFVVQAGDPRGDGWGGPGYTIRDEINPLPFRRGTLGMALAGRHTGGSQFFIALSAQPHLNGGYTVFGSVTGGDEILDRIVQGDRILRIVVGNEE